jgi:hypothetical protein
MLRRRTLASGSAATVVAYATRRSAQAQTAKKVLTVVPQAEPQVFDPVFAQVNNVSMHGAMIYDQLFGWGRADEPAPANGRCLEDL